jgi:hypothetical protein
MGAHSHPLTYTCTLMRTRWGICFPIMRHLMRGQACMKLLLRFHTSTCSGACEQMLIHSVNKLGLIRQIAAHTTGHTHTDTHAGGFGAGLHCVTWTYVCLTSSEQRREVWDGEGWRCGTIRVWVNRPLGHTLSGAYSFCPLFGRNFHVLKFCLLPGFFFSQIFYFCSVFAPPEAPLGLSDEFLTLDIIIQKISPYNDIVLRLWLDSKACLSFKSWSILLASKVYCLRWGNKV